MTKITVAFMRDMFSQVTLGKISFSRMVERINEEAIREVKHHTHTVFSREECMYQYCPHPEMCKDKCAYYSEDTEQLQQPNQSKP